MQTVSTTIGTAGVLCSVFYETPAIVQRRLSLSLSLSCRLARAGEPTQVLTRRRICVNDWQCQGMKLLHLTGWGLTTVPIVSQADPGIHQWRDTAHVDRAVAGSVAAI